MLQTIGQVLFHAVQTTNDLKYTHIRGCVMCTDMENLPNEVIVDLPWGGHVIQDIKYTLLPDTCYRCRQCGNRAMGCTNPNSRGNGRCTGPSRRDINLFTVPQKPAASTQGAKPQKTPQKAPPNANPMEWRPKGKNATAEFSSVATETQVDDDQQLNPPSTQQFTSTQDTVLLTPQPNAQFMTNGSSPPEPSNVAKKRLLEDNAVSPHEEPLSHGDRYDRDRTFIFGPHLPDNLEEDNQKISKQKGEQSSTFLLQELKVRDKDKLQARLSVVSPKSVIYVDYTPSGRRVDAIIVPKNYVVVAGGTLGSGNAAWATVLTTQGEISIMSVHAPNHLDQRIIL
ncbi:hypothetical protein R1sor_001867 [Riccia sorocarpa]|uniref:Uncharacterized protein n=1 Tax=Riccia sorocarpa TaxID=122646 RepID=A0ABD3H0J5_9MARC